MSPISAHDIASYAAGLRTGRSRVRARRGRVADRRPTASAISISPRAWRSTRSATPIRIWSRRSPSRPRSSGTSPISTASPRRERLAERLCAASFADVVFFANSGAEAMECAIKMARKYQSANGQPERYRIITFEGAFHGRTLATLAAGGQKKYLDGFGPVVEGFDQVPFGDLEATKRGDRAGDRRDPDRADQGEGGVRVGAARVPARAARALRRARPAAGLRRGADRRRAHRPAVRLPAVGRHARHHGARQGLGGGFPLGACLATAEAAKGMIAGTHGSTFGGNPLAMAAANARARRGAGRRLPRSRAPHRRCCSSRSSRRSRTAIPTSSPRCAGKGCCVGLRAVVPSGATGRRAAGGEDDHGRGRRQRRAAPAAADRRARTRSPRRCARSTAPATGIAAALQAPQRQGAAAMSSNGIRHFLDLIDIPPAGAARHDRRQPRHEGAAQARATRPSGRSPARRSP